MTNMVLNGHLTFQSHFGLGLDQPGLEPMDWSVWDVKTFEEVVVHRFRPKLVVLATASCPSVLEPLLENQIPCLAVCHLSQKLCAFFAALLSDHWVCEVDCVIAWKPRLY